MLEVATVVGKPVLDEAGEARADKDVVHVQGPADVDVSLTPEAALKTAKRIDEAAVEAIINRFSASKDQEPRS